MGPEHVKNSKAVPRLAVRKLVILVCSAVAIFYLGYRAACTLNLTSPYAVFASLFLYVGEFYGVVTMLLYFLQVWDTTEPPEQPVLQGRTVDVFVPTYNEDPDILRVTLQACVGMHYPHRTYLCDDGGTEARLKDPQKGPTSAERAATLRAICKEVGAIYMTRPKNEHAKAGNLNHAFAQTDGEFIIIFDADHVPDPNFITRLIGYFADDKLAFVQTPHAFYNFDSFQARLNHDRKKYWEEGQLFYHVIQPGRNHWNAPIFAGSAAIFRRKALAEVGYIAMETITEDMHTGLRMHARGWKSLGIGVRMISGQAAQDVTTFHSQRLRWGEGNLSVLAYDNPLTTRGLGWGQKLCYLATMINWCGGLFKLAIYLTPLLMLFTGVPPVQEFTWTLALIMAAYMAVSILGTKYVSNGYGSIWYSELFMMASFWTQVRGTMRAMFLRKLQQFVVTAKRGRQSNSIWPFVRPQVYLIAASVTALLWAWGRVWLGISDDYFKPVLATFWTFFHMLLAYLVVRRALWPDDRRYSTRHLVHLPVGYAVVGSTSELPPAGTPTPLGVSVDLNERGLGFFAYERLPTGSTLRLTLHAPARQVTVAGEIRWASEIVSGAGASGFRYGVAFKNLESAQTDALYNICLHYAVPRLYAFYARRPQRPLEVLARCLAAPLPRRRFAPRREYHLPLFLQPPGQAPLPTVTEDLSRTSASVLLREDLGAGTEVGLALYTPRGRLDGRARVAECRPRVFAARTYWLCALEFVHLEAPGWETLQELFTPGVAGRLRPVLQPRRQLRPVPVNRPLAAAVLLLAPVAGLELALFRWTYRDDFFLQSMAAGNAAPEDLARVDRIFKDTMRQPYPPTDRLVLLSHVLQRVDRPEDMAQVVKLLAPRDRSNFDLQLALAQAYDQHEEFDKAEAEYQRLLAALQRRAIPPTCREELLVGAARAAVHAGRLELAAERFRTVLATWPDRPQYRNEFAGALLGANRLEEAGRVFDGGQPDREGRVLLVMIHTAARRYDAAEREARALLREQPGDPTAEGLLADVLNLRGQHLQAQAIYQRLLASRGADLKIVIQLAHGSLWSRNYQEALTRFQAILDQHQDDPQLARNHPEVFKAYVNAAASAPQLGPAQRQTARALFERALTDAEGDVFFLTRLSWVLHRLGEDGPSATLLERAAALQPTDPALCRQVAAGLLAAGRAEAARALLQGQGSDVEARLLLADSYSVNREYAAAIGVCRALLQDHPDNLEARVKLANLLSYNKEYKESQKIFGELAAQDPGNAAYLVRLAEVALWSGDAPAAVQRYEALLKADFRRPQLWYGFVDAAAACPRLGPSQLALAQAIRDAAAQGQHASAAALEAFQREHREVDEAAFLTRLAWVLIEHLHDPRQAEVLLDRAVALRPAAPPRRKELAGVLAAAHRHADALKMYEGLPLEPADRLRLAQIHAGAEDFPAAAEQCQRILAQQPVHKEAQVLLADVHSWQQQYSASLELFGRLLQAYPDDDYLRRRQAEVLLWSGDVGRALQLFEGLLGANFEQPLLWRGFLSAAARSESLSPAQKHLARRIVARPIADQPGNVELLANAAWVLHQHLDDKARAGTLLMRAVLLSSPEPAVLARLAWVLHRVGDRENRDRVLKRATALRPRKPAACKELAAVLAATGHFPEAQALYEELARTEPHNPDFQMALAELALGSGAWAQALERLQNVPQAEREQPNWRRLFVDAAAGAAILTEPQMRLLLQVVEEPAPGTATQQALYLSRLSWVLLREAGRGQAPTLRNRALTLLDKALALRPTEPRVRQELTGVLLAAGRARDALPWLQDLARNSPGDRAVQRQLALATLSAGEYAEALRRLHGLVEAQPADPELLATFVDAAAGAPRGVMSAAQLELALRLSDRPTLLPTPVVGLTRLSWILLREGRREQAVAALDRALALGSSDPKVRRELAEMLTATGRHEQARALLEELERANPGDASLQGLLARATLWGGNAARALERLEVLLKADFEQPDLWVCYVDAAGTLNKGTLTREQVQLALRLAGRPVPDKAPDKVQYLSRLAWVLHREDHTAAAGPLLDQAVALKPQDPKVRRELAGVLVASGRNEAGLRLFEGLTLTLEDRHQLVVLHAAARQFDQAEKQCRAILQEAPDNRRAREWLAHLALWGTHYAGALELYQALLSADIEGPALWLGYIEAASFVETLTPEQVRIATAIFDRAAASARESVFLARLALVMDRHVEQPRAMPVLSAQLLGLTVAPAGQGPLAGLTALAAEQARRTPARELLLRAVQLRPRDPTGLARLAWVIHQMGFGFHAAQVLDEAIALHPTEPTVRRELGDVLVATGRLKEGLRWFEELVEAFPNNRDLLLRRAEVTVWAGEYARGLDRVEQVLGPNLEPRSLWHTFVDAASSAPSMSPSQTSLALRLAEQPVPVSGVTARAAYLSRLAWSLFRESDRTNTTTSLPVVNRLLDEAMRLQPPGRELRLELAGVLTAVRRYADASALYDALARDFPGDVHIRVRQAEVSLWGRDYPGSLKRFEQLWRDNVRPPRVWAGLVNAAASAKALSRSQAELVATLADQMPPLSDAAEQAQYLSRLSWALVREGKATGNREWLDRAGALLDRAVALRPAAAPVRRELAGVLSAALRHREGLQLFEGRPLELEDRFQLAVLHAGLKQFAEAEQHLQAILAQRPGDARARQWLAQVALWRGRSAEALRALQEQLQQDFHQPGLWGAYASALANAPAATPQQVELAVRIAEQPPADDPEAVSLLTRLAWGLYCAGQRARQPQLVERAGAVAQRAVALRPREAEQRRELAGVLAALGRPQAARGLLEGLPHDERDRPLRISLLVAEKRLDEAEAEVRRLVEQNPRDAEARLVLADVLSWNGKRDEAARIYEQLLRADADDARLPRRLAEVTLWSGDYDKALARYHELLARDWQQPDLWAGYVDAAASARELPADIHRALLVRIAEQVAAESGRDATFLTRLGWVLRRLGEPQRSVVLLKKAVRQEPDSREVRKRLAEALQEAGDYAEAERHYDYLLRTGAPRPGAR
jgi:predicted Zn-dependent protease/cellulose synthase/poly-beta-1,6-N-acetylglucosamine synthase-like glycosyltransferase